MKLFTDIVFIIVSLYIVFMFYQSYQFNKAAKLKTKKTIIKTVKQADNPVWFHHAAEPFQDPIFAKSVIEKRKPVITSYSGDLVMLIKYRTHQGELMERCVTVYGLGKFRNRHYVIGYCHLRNARRTFDIRKFKKSIDLNTGEIIIHPMIYILIYNPVITDLTDEFEALEQERLASDGFYQ